MSAVCTIVKVKSRYYWCCIHTEISIWMKSLWSNFGCNFPSLYAINHSQHWVTAENEEEKNSKNARTQKLIYHIHVITIITTCPLPSIFSSHQYIFFPSRLSFCYISVLAMCKLQTAAVWQNITLKWNQDDRIQTFLRSSNKIATHEIYSIANRCHSKIYKIN